MPERAKERMSDDSSIKKRDESVFDPEDWSSKTDTFEERSLNDEQVRSVRDVTLLLNKQIQVV